MVVARLRLGPAGRIALRFDAVAAPDPQRADGGHGRRDRREYSEKGRLLLVATTNLDVPVGVLWNIGAIAASGRTRTPPT
jgi:hypothetical protein